MPTDTLTLRARLRAPAEAVHAALTDPAALTTWLAEEAGADLAAGRYTFRGRSVPQGDADRQRLLTAGPDGFVFAWTLDGVPTRVEFTVASTGDGSTLLLRQDQLPTMDELMAPAGRRDGLQAMHTYWPLTLANLAAYVEDRPLTPRADFGPDRSLEISTRFSVDAGPGPVFASLTDPVAVERWFGWKPETEARTGGRMAVGVDGKIFAFEPGRRLAYGDDEGSVVRWELEGSQGRTSLTFVQSGYTQADDAAQHEAGWYGAFAELQRLHELGDAWYPLITDLTEEDPGTGH